MSALKSRSNSLAGLSLDAILGGDIVIQQPSSPPSPPPLPQKTIVPHRPTSQTLFDIIREEYVKEGHKDRTTWQIFREKLRLKRSGSAWTSSLPIPASDILIPNTKHFGTALRSHPAGLTNGNIRELVNVLPMSDPPGSSGRAMFTRGSSMRVGSIKNHPDDSPDINVLGDGPSSRSFKPQLSRHDSVRDHSDVEEDNRRRPPIVTFVEERQMSAREAVAAQEAAEAEAAAAGGSEDEDEDDDDEEEETEENKSSSASAPKQTMSLMDLLEETDRQMGLTGSRYAMDDEEEYEEEEDDENYEEEGDGHGGGEGELSCCACMVKIKGASFSPCGHTFCKLCSKELMAQKGHCPVCSSFVVEFLEIF
ncbi:PREDICTED: E3 ubiquitin-protein ligase RNF34-like [Camelina sativa]|uniref:E3 ubiquitin-protein ligase RNF34-like n=1 Tax=Camelina sativa TaxID=90675 RepID=A0ABM0W1A8_CAMSA|nr:PREDICTED: E3 ubiquitin-protein ligase RNF34-like [Camelina sativa]